VPFFFLPISYSGYCLTLTFLPVVSESESHAMCSSSYHLSFFWVHLPVAVVLCRFCHLQLELEVFKTVTSLQWQVPSLFSLPFSWTPPPPLSSHRDHLASHL
jgi:hypothetical protein